MHFVDEVRVFVKAGNGGKGCISFLREKYRPRGGPNGGNGGNGGSVIFQVDPQLSTLLDLRYSQHIRAARGEHGRGKDRHGRNAPDRFVRVPPGTLIRDLDSAELLADLTQPDSRVVVARGGKGGRGNAFFASARNRLPRQAQPGLAGEERTLRLELRVLADVGLVGFPNAGKSTLLSSVSAARPRIADFPFTTLTPNLGVVRYGDDGTFVMADIPGLIEGAHEGHGLGARFLRHLSRTSVLVYLLDISDPQRDPWHDYGVLTRELHSFDPALVKRPQLVVVTKYDLPTTQERFAEMAATFAAHDIGLMALSAVSREGVNDLIWKIAQTITDARKRIGENAADPGTPVQPSEEDQTWD
jgi:GTP-binding protein